MEFMNVKESYPYYDTLIVSETLYGSEQNLGGFFNTFAAFNQRPDHSLFKIRSEALAGLAYNNQATQDRLEFAFRGYSLGVRFFAPSFSPQHFPAEAGPDPHNDQLMSTFWCLDLPRHCGVEFRIGQDVKLTGQPFRLPPGYGPHGGGVGQSVESFSNVDPTAEWSLAQNQLVVAMNQGVPDVSNRFIFRPPLGIPRTETIEVRIYLSDIARRILTGLSGPGEHKIPQEITTVGEEPVITWKTVPARYGIQASLWGVREVQQRGQLHV